MIVLARHAHAGSRDAWNGDDRFRPLDERGQRQARLLAERFAEHRITRVVSSPYLRCVQTVQPFAEMAGLTVERSSHVAEGASFDAAMMLLDTDDLVICTHGDVVGEMVRRLAAAGVPVDPAIPVAKSGAWWLETQDGSVVAASYSAPPA